MKPDLSGVPETLLIPLLCRALETLRPDAIIKDDKAVEMLQSIDYNFSRFERAWMSQVGVAVRTEILDSAVGAFIRRHPEAVVVNLGAGLDTRYERLDNGRIRWYDLDLPDVIELRIHFFNQTDRHRLIPKSIFDVTWGDEIEEAAGPVLLIAEGFLIYFEERDVRGIFANLVNRFPGAEMLFEMLGPALVGKGRFHDAISRVSGAEFRWSLKDGRAIEAWDDRIKFIQEWYYTDYYNRRWGWFGWVTRIQLFKKWLSNRIVHVRFES